MTDIKAVIFDWAGTMIDHGCFGPVAAFQEIFAEIGINVSQQACRAPMGLPKKDHIKAMLDDKALQQTVFERTGKMPDSQMVESLYGRFLAINEALVLRHTDVITGAIDCVNYLRSRQIKIGSNTGYGRDLMEKIVPLAASQGYEPDNLVCGDDLAEGRPGPLMMYRCMADLGVYPPQAIIKVDDTTPGIAEGIAIGAITVGLTLTGNLVGLSEEALAALSDTEKDNLHNTHAKTLKSAGADHVLRSVAELPALIDKLMADQHAQ